MIDRSQHLGMVAVRGHLNDFRADLVIKGYDPQEQQKWTRRVWEDLGDDVFGLPRAYALSRKIEPEYAYGYEVDPQARPSFTGKWAYQENVVAEAVAAFQRGVSELIFQAYTGSGKTVMGIEIACRLNVNALILVDQNKLLRQWRDDSLVDHFGYSKSEIGIVQGETFEFENDFNIAMIQSVYDREFDDEFYQQFGMVIYDECHVAGADQFSRVLEMFPARYRMGMSATPDRKDSLSKLIKLHLEQERVVLREARQQSRVYVVPSTFVGSWYGNTSPKTGRYISEIAEDGVRNALLVKIIQWFHEQDRKALIIGERIVHLENLVALAILAGVPEDKILLYTGREHYYKLAKNPEPTRDPEDYVKGTEYTPVCLLLKERKVNLEKRDHLLNERRLIFSTYSVFSKGVDVPDLDAGLDATPRTAFVQQHGRILRKATGKRIPIWVTLRDYNSSRAEYQFSKRIQEFVKSNAETFIWPIPGEGELIRKAPDKLRKEAEWRREKLKDERIITGADGTFTLQTPPIVPESFASNGRRTTAKRARSNRR